MISAGFEPAIPAFVQLQT